MVLGPGGCGVSVVATAGAAERPRAPRDSRQSVTRPARHTLLVTLDRNSPTASWAGVYRQPGEVVAVSQYLHLLTLDRLDLSEQTWAAFVDVLSESVRRSKVALPGVGTIAGVDAAELTALPGIEDFLLLRRIRDEATSGQWQRIVVDCSGVGDPFAFLRAAAVLSQALNRFWPRHRRLAAAAERPVMAALTAAVDAIDRDCADLSELITDASAVAVHLVVGADDRGCRLVAPMLADIDVMGLPLTSVVVNEAGGPGSQDVVARLNDLVAERSESAGVVVGVRAVGRAPDTIDRLARLRKLGVTLAAPHGVPQGSAAAMVESVGGAGVQATYRMSWPQGLPDPDGLVLGRSGDDLLVTVSGFRHPIRLPSMLRRCTVVDAEWDGVRLAISFVPDPAVWPKR
ncbi:MULTISPECIES: ArsA-related P-loop ATPase [unclassified Gordonia (in: high G+C Gram-positive bacteria)]|uniref:ArsA-related P-loop ATPase n=2 Tax=unclassified Gordonia (in: high G+C Gram-positive bacteria) TaxID=2657482 RepID=UPI003D8C8E18